MNTASLIRSVLVSGVLGLAALGSVAPASASTVIRQQVTQFGNRITKTRVVGTNDFGGRFAAVRVSRTDAFGNRVSATRVSRIDAFGNRISTTRVVRTSGLGF